MTAPVQTGTPATGTPGTPAAGAPTGTPAGAPAGQQGAPADRGYPEGTPLEQMTDAQQAAYWRHHSRKHEQRAAQAPPPDELAQLRDKAAKFDAAEQANLSELEKLQKANADLQARVAAADLAEMRRQACRDAGLPESDHVWLSAATTTAAAKELAEQLKARGGSNGTGTAASHDQGVRRQPATSARDQGLAEAEKRFGKPKTT